MNKYQKWFDTVVEKIFAQGKPAISATGKCYYLTDDKLRCAVGVLVPDDQIDMWKDKLCGIRNIPKPMVDAAGIESTTNNLDFLSRLQNVHDNAARSAGLFMEKFISGMRIIAYHYSLDTTKLEEQTDVG